MCIYICRYIMIFSIFCQAWSFAFFDAEAKAYPHRNSVSSSSASAPNWSSCCRSESSVSA